VGYLDADSFLGGEMKLSAAKMRGAIGRLAAQLGMDPASVAIGIQDLVVENMAAAARMHLAEKGRDPRAYTLMAFGGAGPVHAYALAKALKVARVVIPMGAGVISAFGFLVAAPTVDDVRGYPTPLRSANWERVAALYADMETRARELLRSPGTADEDVIVTRSADMRYLGQGFEIEVPLPHGVPDAGQHDMISIAFAETYDSVFGRTIRDGTPEIVNWRLSARRPGVDISLAYRPVGTEPRRGQRPIRFAGFGELAAGVYDRYALTPGTTIQGPAVFEERDSSFSVGPDCTVTVDARFNLIVDISPA
jgi:N-methylhydantoinase A